MFCGFAGFECFAVCFVFVSMFGWLGLLARILGSAWLVAVAVGLV